MTEQDLIEIAGKRLGWFVPVMTLVAASLAVIYELGYYCVAGLDFFPVVPLYDHFMSAMMILPMVALMCLYLAAGPFIGYYSGRAIDNILGKMYKSTDVVEKSNNIYFNIFKYFIVIFVGCFGFVVPWGAVVSFISVVIVISSMVFLDFSGRKKVSAINRKLVGAIGIVVGALGGTFAIGEISALDDVTLGGTSIVTLCGHDRNCSTFKAIKMTSNGAIVEDGGHLKFSSYDRSIQIEKTTPPVKTHLLHSLISDFCWQ